jgi:hypothetical protein
VLVAGSQSLFSLMMIQRMIQRDLFRILEMCPLLQAQPEGYQQAHRLGKTMMKQR